MEDFTNELILKLNSISWQLKRIADVMERDQKTLPSINHPPGPRSILRHMMDELNQQKSDLR